MTAPTGCSLAGFDATCSYSTWTPPLMDSQFSAPPGTVIVNDINGVVASGSFSGLENSGMFSGTPQLSLDCGFGNNYEMTLLSDSLSTNLSWVEAMLVTDCYNMKIESGAFSVLTGLTLLTIMAGNFTSISSSAFSGMTSLSTLYLYAGFPSSGIPSGLFDGLTALTNIDMSRTTINSLPSGLFNDQTILTSLQLLDCGLTTLPSDVFYPLLSLTTLDIGENSWVCDCDLQWLGTYLTTSASDDGDEKWYRYGLIAGCSMALILAVIAISGFVYQRMQYDELVKAMQKITTAEHVQTTKITNIKSNQNKTVADLPTESARNENGKSNVKDKNVWSVQNEEYTRHQGSPFNKRHRQISPSHVKVQKGWASQRDPDEW